MLHLQGWGGQASHSRHGACGASMAQLRGCPGKPLRKPLRNIKYLVHAGDAARDGQAIQFPGEITAVPLPLNVSPGTSNAFFYQVLGRVYRINVIDKQLCGTNFGPGRTCYRPPRMAALPPPFGEFLANDMVVTVRSALGVDSKFDEFPEVRRAWTGVTFFTNHGTIRRKFIAKVVALDLAAIESSWEFGGLR